jgi:hypothetical protein
MKKLDKARFYRNGYKAMRDALMKDMVETLKAAEDNELELDDDQGSLIYNSIDDQESEVIQSVYLRYPDKVIAKIGAYEPDYEIEVNDMSIELLLNIMDAVEEAVNVE